MLLLYHDIRININKNNCVYFNGNDDLKFIK